MNTIVMTPELRAAAVARQRAERANCSRIVSRATDEMRNEICESAVEHYQRNGYGDIEGRFTPSLGIEPRPGPKPQRAGKYRVIHGSIFLGTFTRPDGSRYSEYARVGDVVQLSSENATLLMGTSAVEPADVDPKESRCGKVWNPPRPVRNYRADYAGGVSQKGGPK